MVFKGKTMRNQTLMTAEFLSFSKILYSFAISVVERAVPILAAIFGFGFVTFVHECGHFIFCKIFKVSAPTFSVGFGPVLLEKKIYGTKFRISAIPVGGYTEIKDEVNENNTEETSHTVPQDSFRAKPYWQKLIILVGGIAFNLILALILFSGISWFGPVGKSLKELKILKVMPNSAAEMAGLEKDFIITGIEKIDFAENKSVDFSYFSNILHQNLGKPIDLHIKKSPDSQSSSIVTIKLNDMETAHKTGSAMGVILEPILGQEINAPRPGFFKSVVNGFQATWFYASGTFSALKYIFVKRSVDLLGGPVMIISQSLKHAKDGILPLIFFLAYFSVSLAILNLLPIGILDGGRILVETFEALIGRPIPALRMMTNLGTIVLLLLFVVLTYKDIYRLIFGK